MSKGKRKTRTVKNAERTDEIAREDAARAVKLARATKAHTLITQAVRMINEAHTEIEAVVGSSHAAATIASAAVDAGMKARAWADNVVKIVARTL